VTETKNSFITLTPNRTSEVTITFLFFFFHSDTDKTLVTGATMNSVERRLFRRDFASATLPRHCRQCRFNVDAR